MTQALAEGPLGAALLPVERGDLDQARPLLSAAVHGGVSTGANASLFHGAPALEFVLSVGRWPRLRSLRTLAPHDASRLEHSITQLASPTYPSDESRP